MKTFSLTICAVLLASGSLLAQKIDVKKAFKQADEQTLVMLKEVQKVKAGKGKSDLATPRTIEDGNLKLVASKDWTSGFFPGELWFLYEYTGKKGWMDQAKAYTS